ncbi:MAG: glycosyltransferase [Phycisphaerae bacterium]|nr:glycosyltransferase [Phycisphaerae bacterium]
MRVLVVMSKFVAGGAETTALRLISALQAGGYEFVVASVKDGGDLTGELRRTGAVVYDGVARFKRDPLGLWRLARIIRRHRIDAVICIGEPRDAMFYATLAPVLAFRCIPRICWCNSRPAGQSGNFVPRFQCYRRMGLLTAVVCASRVQRRMLLEGGLTRRHLPVIRNGLDAARFTGARPVGLGVAPGVKVIVQIANVVPDKDHATLLAAGGLLRRRRDDFRIVLVGRGTDSPEITARIAEAALGDTVICAGQRDDIPGVLAAADVFVLSTHGEVSSVATIEAFAAGVPAVVSDIPAFDEMLTDGREGLRVAPDDPAALADAIEAILDDPTLAAKLVDNAAERFKQYELSTMVRRFDRLLRAIGR